jgi:hypothetical protein
MTGCARSLCESRYAPPLRGSHCQLRMVGKSLRGPAVLNNPALRNGELKGARTAYFDLEKPSDLQVFTGDIEYALRQLKGPLILDEGTNAAPAVSSIARLDR